MRRFPLPYSLSPKSGSFLRTYQQQCVMAYSHWPSPRVGQDQEQMGYMKLCGSPIVSYCSNYSPCACLGSGSAQCECTITRIKHLAAISLSRQNHH